MPTTPQPGMKKRQVIANSNRTMFVWVAMMSAVVGICAVLAYFLIQQIVFKGNVASATETTASTLEKNLKVIPTLTQDLQVMETNAALNTSKSSTDEKALRVILDALPADPNTLALGSSLQQKLISDIPDLTIESLTVLPYSDTSATSDANTLPFTLTVKSGSADSLKQLLARFEKSIRTIDIDTLTVERSNSGYTMTMEAHAYFQPAMTVELGSQVIPASGKAKK